MAASFVAVAWIGFFVAALYPVAVTSAASPTPDDITLVDEIFDRTKNGVIDSSDTADFNLLLRQYKNVVDGDFSSLRLSGVLGHWFWRSASSQAVDFICGLFQSGHTSAIKLAAVLMVFMDDRLLVKNAPQLLSLLFEKTSGDVPTFLCFYEHFLNRRLKLSSYKMSDMKLILDVFLKQSVEKGLRHSKSHSHLFKILRHLWANADLDALESVLVSSTNGVVIGTLRNPMQWSLVFYDGIVRCFAEERFGSDPWLWFRERRVPDAFLEQFLALFVVRENQFDSPRLLDMLLSQDVVHPLRDVPSQVPRKQRRAILDTAQAAFWGPARPPTLVLRLMLTAMGRDHILDLIRSCGQRLRLTIPNWTPQSFPTDYGPFQATIGEIFYHCLERPNFDLSFDNMHSMERALLLDSLAIWDNSAHQISQSAPVSDIPDSEDTRLPTDRLLRLLPVLGATFAHLQLFQLAVLSWAQPIWDGRRVLQALIHHRQFLSATSWERLQKSVHDGRRHNNGDLGRPLDAALDQHYFAMGRIIRGLIDSQWLGLKPRQIKIRPRWAEKRFTAADLATRFTVKDVCCICLCPLTGPSDSTNQDRSSSQDSSSLSSSASQSVTAASDGSITRPVMPCQLHYLHWKCAARMPEAPDPECPMCRRTGPAAASTPVS